MSLIEARFRIDWPGFVLDVDLSLPSKGVTALFGHSGSGKTTLLRCIAGLERAQEGRLVVDGQVWQDETTWVPIHKRPIGYVFQEASLFEHLTVIGNLRYGMNRIAKSYETSLEQSIELLGIGHLLDRRPGRLSGGERQRVSIARALAVSPRLLLMDEPLSALDLKRKKEILPYLERLHEELDIPVLYVSHSPDEVARLADHLVVMEDGCALTNGPLADTLTRLDLPFQLNEDSGTILDGTVVDVDDTWHLTRVAFSGGSLWARDNGLKVGQRVRVRILARDVSLAADIGATSVQNVLQGCVEEIVDDVHAGIALVRLKVGTAVLLSRITKRAAHALEIKPGKMVWILVKSVALL